MHIFPDVLEGIELRRSRRQGDRRYGGWQIELVGGVPTRLIEQDDAMRTGCYLRCDLIEMPLHSGGIASEYDHGRASAAGGTHCTAYEGRRGAMIFGGQWLGYLILLTSPSSVLNNRQGQQTPRLV
mgnify:CR=1 FL=1